MKRGMKLSLGFGLAGIVLSGAFVVNFYGPYNMLHAASAYRLAENDEVKEHVDGEIVSVKYVGKNTYCIDTDKNKYILIYTGDHNFARYQVYEYADEFEYFKNPM